MRKILTNGFEQIERRKRIELGLVEKSQGLVKTFLRIILIKSWLFSKIPWLFSPKNPWRVSKKSGFSLKFCIFSWTFHHFGSKNRFFNASWRRYLRPSISLMIFKRFSASENAKKFDKICPKMSKLLPGWCYIGQMDFKVLSGDEKTAYEVFLNRN